MTYWLNEQEINVSSQEEKLEDSMRVEGEDTIVTSTRIRLARYIYFLFV